VIVGANYLLMRLLFPGAEPVKVPYTLFKEEVTRSNVEKIYSRGESLTGRFKAPVIYPPPKPPTESGAPSGGLEPRRSPEPEPKEVTDFATTLPAFVDSGLEALLISNGVEISAEPLQGQETWLGLLF